VHSNAAAAESDELRARVSTCVGRSAYKLLLLLLLYSPVVRSLGAVIYCLIDHARSIAALTDATHRQVRLLCGGSMQYFP
jgi:hypothetical protein